MCGTVQPGRRAASHGLQRRQAPPLSKQCTMGLESRHFHDNTARVAPRGWAARSHLGRVNHCSVARGCYEILKPGGSYPNASARAPRGAGATGPEPATTLINEWRRKLGANARYFLHATKGKPPLKQAWRRKERRYPSAPLGDCLPLGHRNPRRYTAPRKAACGQEQQVRDRAGPRTAAAGRRRSP